MADPNTTINEWTIMFFFATDNELSPLNISQIKSVKEAGYQKNTECLLYFDSNEKGVPTRLFNMNKSRKGFPPGSLIGDGKDPFVRSFLKDELFAKDMNPGKGRFTAKVIDMLKKPDSTRASESLENFIGFCRENSPAKHYILFLVGHGLIVANDNFLLDNNPQSGISLQQLGEILSNFKKEVDKQDGEFELIGFHSCSMSAIEVACELRNTAKYMIASEGLSYVGSWPYRQLMKKIFNVTEKGLTAASVQELVQRIYELSLHNAPDFAYSGYSHDLTLCSLAEEKISALLNPLRQLIDTLKSSLQNPRGKQLILLAHLQSQSFWGESQTDIYDFCRCLVDNCDRSDPAQEALANSCDAVMAALTLQTNPFDGLVVLSDNFGWEYQFAHGLSIYFPWSKPLGDVNDDPLEKYADYAFNKMLVEDSWLDFLKAYWDATMRSVNSNSSTAFFDEMLEASPESTIFEAFNNNLSGRPGDSIPRLGALGLDPNKPNGSVGGGCSCTSIKNFPIVEKFDRRIRRLSATPKVARAFDQSDERSQSER